MVRRVEFVIVVGRNNKRTIVRVDHLFIAAVETEEFLGKKWRRFRVGDHMLFRKNAGKVDATPFHSPFLKNKKKV